MQIKEKLKGVSLKALLLWPLIVAAVADVLTFLQFSTVFIMGIVVSGCLQAFKWYRRKDPEGAAKVDKQIAFLKKKGTQVANAVRTPVE